MSGLMWIVLAGCPGTDKDSSGPEESGDTATGTESGTDTATTPDVPPPCAGGSWGRIEADVAATGVHVSAAADAGGDGSGAHPFQTIEEALAATRADGGPRGIAVWPGVYATSLDLGQDLGDDGLKLQGCGRDEVTLEASDDDAPIVKVSAAQGLDLRGFTLSGGTRGLWVWQGATFTGTDLAAVDNRRLGIVIDGSSSVAGLSEIRVADPVRVGDFGGFGIAIQGAQVTLTDAEITGATENGIVIDGSSSVAALSSVSVSGTAARSDGQYGRGVQVQERASASLTDVTLTDNHDAGLFGLGATAIDLVRVTVSGTASASIADSDETSGDGIVITDGAPEENWAERYFRASFEDVVTTDTRRIGVLVAGNGLTAAMDAVSISAADVDPSGAFLPLSQDLAEVTGDPAYDLDTQLAFTPTAVTVDDFGP